MPNDWRKLNGCACHYCQNVWKDEAVPEPELAPMYGIEDGSIVRDKQTGKAYRLYEMEASLTEGDELRGSSDHATVVTPEPSSNPGSASPSASESFDRVLDRLKILATKKGKDYGTEDDTIANLRAAEDFGMPSWVGCLLRANDKIRRLQTFVKQGRLFCEPADDALEDLAVYAVWCIVLRNEELAKTQATFPPGRIVEWT